MDSIRTPQLSVLVEISTMMGDHLGSPRVGPLYLGLTGTIPACRMSSEWVRPFLSPSALGDRQSEHPIVSYGPSKSRILDFSPFFSKWKIPSFRDDRRKRQAFLNVEAKVIGGNAWWRGVDPRWRGWVS